MLERVNLQESHNPKSAHEAARQIIRACEQKAAIQAARPVPLPSMVREQSAIVRTKPVEQ